MMPNVRRVIAIDDEPAHLACLADGLDRHGLLCYRFHYTDGGAGIGPCPDARIIFADLHLGGGAFSMNPMTEFGVIGSLLEDAIKPSGPYLILLWTMYPDYAPELQTFLGRLRGVTKPVAIHPLAKADYLDGNGNLRDETGLMKRIDALTIRWMRPEGALALVGAWGELDDQEVDELIGGIYAARWNDKGQPVELED